MDPARAASQPRHPDGRFGPVAGPALAADRAAALAAQADLFNADTDTGHTQRLPRGARVVTVAGSVVEGHLFRTRWDTLDGDGRRVCFEVFDRLTHRWRPIAGCGVDLGPAADLGDVHQRLMAALPHPQIAARRLPFVDSVLGLQARP